MAVLSEALQTLKALRADRCGPFVDASVLSNAGTAVENGTMTVGMTYALFKIRNNIQKLSDRQQRKNAVEAVRNDLQQKCGTINLGKHRGGVGPLVRVSAGCGRTRACPF